MFKERLYRCLAGIIGGNTVNTERGTVTSLIFMRKSRKSIVYECRLEYPSIILIYVNGITNKQK